MTGPTPETVPLASPWWKRKRNRLILLGSALVALAAAVVWFWPRGFTPRPAPVSLILQPAPVALAPGVYLLGKSSPAAAYMVETSEGLVLIDSGLEADASAVAGQIKELGFEVKQLRAILLTHVHADHSLGARQLRELTGAKIYAGRGDCPPLRDGGPREAFFSNYYMPQVSAHATTVDVELGDNDTIPFGETRFVALATPGHTPGSVCYLLERPDLRALFTGDIVQALERGNRGALGTYTVYLPPLYRGNTRDFLASLRRLRTLPVPDLILPGHPQMDDIPQSPHLSEERWQSLLDQGIAELTRVLARYEADGANFLDGIPKEPLPGLHYLGNFGGSAIYCLASAKGVFLFDAPGGPELVDFLAKRFQKLGWQERKVSAVLLTSAGDEATAGLAALVRSSGCQVVAPKAGLDTVRRLCPASAQVHSADDLAQRGWFEGRALSLAGRGLAPVAYQLRWADKTVLVSGRIPMKVSAKTPPPLAKRLLAEITGPEGSVEEYLKALARLAEVNPALWLPAVPVDGQNANIYDDDWPTVLRSNRQFLMMNLQER